MTRRIAIAVAALVFLGLLVFSLLSWRTPIAPVERPNPASFTAQSVARGEVLGWTAFALMRAALIKKEAQHMVNTMISCGRASTRNMPDCRLSLIVCAENAYSLYEDKGWSAATHYGLRKGKPGSAEKPYRGFGPRVPMPLV